MKQGEPQTEMFFIRKGIVKVMQDLEYEGKLEKVQIGVLSPEEYFGQEAALTNDSSARYTLVAAENLLKSTKKKFVVRPTDVEEKVFVEVLVFRIFDMKDLKTFLRPSRFAEITPADLLEIKLGKENKKKWLKQRKKVMDVFVKELTGNCLMNSKTLKQAQNLKRTREDRWVY